MKPVGRTVRRLARAGFTFLEMMAIIAIIGLLASLVFTNMDSMTARTELSGVARALGNEIVYLHDLAALQGRDLTLQIDMENQRWRAVEVPAPMDVPDEDEREERTYYGPWFELEETVVLDEIAFGLDDVEADDLIEITFDRDGELSPSGFNAYIRHLDLDEDDGLTVEVTGLTGIVSYHRGRIEPEEVRDEDDF